MTISSTPTTDHCDIINRGHCRLSSHSECALGVPWTFSDKCEFSDIFTHTEHKQLNIDNFYKIICKFDFYDILDIKSMITSSKNILRDCMEVFSEKFNIKVNENKFDTCDFGINNNIQIYYSGCFSNSIVSAADRGTSGSAVNNSVVLAGNVAATNSIADSTAKNVPKTNNTISLFYTNCQGLRSKFSKLKAIPETYSKCQILCITETHLDHDIHDAEVHIPNFQCFRRDRGGDKEGGGHVSMCIMV